MGVWGFHRTTPATSCAKTHCRASEWFSKPLLHHERKLTVRDVGDFIELPPQLPVLKLTVQRQACDWLELPLQLPVLKFMLQGHQNRSQSPAALRVEAHGVGDSIELSCNFLC